MCTEDEKGTPLISEYLNDSYGKLNAKYYGPVVEEDPEIKFEWSRILHFYYSYYVSQYSTGLSAASAPAKRILSQEPDALENYLAYLKVGNSDHPAEVTKKVGVDMTQAAYIKGVASMFEQRLNELEELIDCL